VSSVTFNKVQLQSQYSELKKKSSSFKRLKYNSGFGFDEATQMPVTDEKTWTEYMNAHPGAAQFRRKSLDN
jgi:hypothetical protein